MRFDDIEIDLGPVEEAREIVRLRLHQIAVHAEDEHHRLVAEKNCWQGTRWAFERAAVVLADTPWGPALREEVDAYLAAVDADLATKPLAAVIRPAAFQRSVAS